MDFRSRQSITIIIGVVVLGTAAAIVVFLIASPPVPDSVEPTAELVEAPKNIAEPITLPSSSPLAPAEALPLFSLVTPTAPESQATIKDIELTSTAEEDLESVVEPSPIGPLSHVIKEGENLFRIAEAYGVTVEAIMFANNLADARFIVAGETVIIPGSQSLAADDPTTAATTQPTAEIVQSTPEPTPEETSTPTAISETPTQTVPAAATIPVQPANSLNGISIDQIVVMPPDVVQNARVIFTNGQRLGRNPHAFSKVGDSTIENPHFLARFDEGEYDLGIYSYLQPTIDYFQGSHGRQGNAVKRGLHSWTVLDPLWADDEICNPNETPLACELRLHNPSILLVRLGSNDKGVPAGFDQNVRQVVDYAIEQGVLPIIGTKADRFEGEDNINNIMLRQIAEEYKLPLWDFDLAAGTLPGRGIYEDDVHLTIYYAHDYTSPVALQRGHGVHNLTALMVLDAVRREVIQAGG